MDGTTVARRATHEIQDRLVSRAIPSEMDVQADVGEIYLLFHFTFNRFDTWDIIRGMPTKCPKCPVFVVEGAAGGWTFEPRIGCCVDLRGTIWGNKGKYEWCPTLAAAVPSHMQWPGILSKETVEREIATAQAEPKAQSSVPGTLLPAKR
jgi:hypothetical protein